MKPFTTSAEESPFRKALRIGLIYLILSALWIYVSDTALGRMVVDPVEMRRLQTAKGWAFVLVSSLLIIYLVYREIVRVRESGSRFRALVEQSLAGVYLIREGRFLYVNPKLADVFGYDVGEMVKSVSVLDVVAEEDREMVVANLALREEGQTEELHYRFTGVRKDREKIRVEVHGRRVSWEGEPAVLGTLLDVSGRERLEAQAREAHKLEALGTLTGQIAHDFNNYLTAIISPLDLVLEEPSVEGDVRADVEEARASASRAAALSRKLLAFSRNRPGLPRALDVNSMLREMDSLLDRLVGPGVTLSLDLASGPCTVKIDPSDLEQVVMNLVLNAAEAVEGRGRVMLRTGTVGGGPAVRGEAASSGQVWLEVEDDGAGIDEETRQRIFEPFFSTKSDGTGLGLSIVFGIVTQAEGTIEVRSETEEGTCFRLLIPESREAPERVSPRSEEEGSAASRPLGAGETVLLVEDTGAVRRTMVRALERFGYDVLQADTVEEAVTLASAPGVGVDLVLTDVKLPDGLGPEVVERVSALHPEAGVLYVSGYSEREITDRIATDPVVRLLEKPFSVDALLRAVRKALGAGGKGGSTRVG